MRLWISSVLFLLSLVSITSNAKYPPNFEGFKQEQVVRDDSALVKANQDRRGVRFVRATNMKVIQILPDDERGSRHQKFYVQLSDTSKIYAVYSLEDGRERVPVKIGSVVALAGEYKWTRFGGMVHWLHEDVKDRRPDGYVEVGGVRYGKDD